MRILSAFCCLSTFHKGDIECSVQGLGLGVLGFKAWACLARKLEVEVSGLRSVGFTGWGGLRHYELLEDHGVVIGITGKDIPLPDNPILN